ncbi:MAG: IreB family regulatory phosphoprotein [Clostridiales bacterium]|nr:IreB family regulatory phosphoprotein [Clostridiales bacterium]
MLSKETGKELNRETREFTRLSDNDKMIRETLLAVYTALIEKGYNPIRQLVGYILSEDPTYITNHKNARTLISRFDRDELLEALVKYYIGV